MNLKDKLNAVIEQNTFFIPKSDEVEEKYSNLLSKIKLSRCYIHTFC